MGASVIPFCHGQGKVSFLFHKTFSGRRAGCLVDFGGGGSEGESGSKRGQEDSVDAEYEVVDD